MFRGQAPSVPRISRAWRSRRSGSSVPNRRTVSSYSSLNRLSVSGLLVGPVVLPVDVRGPQSLEEGQPITLPGSPSDLAGRLRSATPPSAGVRNLILPCVSKRWQPTRMSAQRTRPSVTAVRELRLDLAETEASTRSRPNVSIAVCAPGSANSTALLVPRMCGQLVMGSHASRSAARVTPCRMAASHAISPYGSPCSRAMSTAVRAMSSTSSPSITNDLFRLGSRRSDA